MWIVLTLIWLCALQMTLHMLRHVRTKSSIIGLSVRVLKYLSLFDVHVTGYRDKLLYYKLYKL